MLHTQTHIAQVVYTDLSGNKLCPARQLIALSGPKYILGKFLFMEPPSGSVAQDGRLVCKEGPSYVDVDEMCNERERKHIFPQIIELSSNKCRK